MTGSSWSLKVGRLAGIDVRVHLLFIIFAASELLKALPQGSEALKWALIGQGLWALIVLCHEFGHCFAGRYVGGNPQSVLLWPLGGLAFVDRPETPRAHLIVSAGGPAVNLVFAVVSGGLLFLQNDFPGFWPTGASASWLAWFYQVNYWLLLLNLLPAFPLDGGSILRAVMWPRLGYDRATYVAISAGRVAAVLVGIYGIAFSSMLVVGFALFMYVSCEQERMLLAERQIDTFGSSFDLGTAGWDGRGQEREREPETAVRRRRPSLFERFARWRRRGRPRPPEELTEPEIRRRVDELLDKIHREGMDSLSPQERDFLREASQYYK